MAVRTLGAFEEVMFMAREAARRLAEFGLSAVWTGSSGTTTHISGEQPRPHFHSVFRLSASSSIAQPHLVLIFM